MFVAAFSNTDFDAPGFVSTKMTTTAIDKPCPEISNAVSFKAEALAALIGVYEFEDGTLVVLLRIL